MGFKNLVSKDIDYIVDLYRSNKPRDVVQEILSEKFNVSKRTVRKWAKKLGISTNNSCLDYDLVVKSKSGSNILVIGDLHEPFCLRGYREFCKMQYDKYNCDMVVFIGDVIDNHYSSYHETDANGMGGGEELKLAKGGISKWNKIFPEATVIIGNHDRMIMRKAQTSQIPKEWIKSYKEVLEVPKWNFVDRLVIGDIQFVHGEAGTARVKAKSDLMSTVQGHLHTQCYTEWVVGANFKIFASQVGCGVDHDSYAMAYAKRGKKPAIGCMVILNEETPINILMNL